MRRTQGAGDRSGRHVARGEGTAGGAPKGQPLLKDDPIALNQPAPSGKAHAEGTVFTGGHRNPDTRAFPG